MEKLCVEFAQFLESTDEDSFNSMLSTDDIVEDDSELELVSEFCVQNILNLRPEPVEVDVDKSSDICTNDNDSPPINNVAQKSVNNASPSIYSINVNQKTAIQENIDMSLEVDSVQDKESSCTDPTATITTTTNKDDDDDIFLEAWVCKTCREEIPEKDIEVHLTFHPISSYSSSPGHSKEYSSFLSYQRYNDLPEVLGNALFDTQANISINSQEDFPCVNLDEEPENSITEAPSSPISVSSCSSSPQRPLSNTPIQTPVKEGQSNANNNTHNTHTPSKLLLTSTDNNRDKSKASEPYQDEKLRLVVEKLKQRYQKPEAKVVVDGPTRGTFGTATSKKNKNEKNSPSQVSSAASSSPSSASSSPEYKDENILPQKNAVSINNSSKKKTTAAAAAKVPAKPTSSLVVPETCSTKQITTKEISQSRNSISEKPSSQKATKSTINSKLAISSSSTKKQHNNNNAKANGKKVAGCKNSSVGAYKLKPNGKTTPGKGKLSISKLVGSNGKKRPAKTSLASQSASKKLKLDNSHNRINSATPSNQESEELQSSATPVDSENQSLVQISKQLEVMVVECNKELPNLDVLIKCMDATSKYRQDNIASGMKVPEAVQLFPALRNYHIIRREFEQLNARDLNVFDVKLKERLEQEYLVHCAKYKDLRGVTGENVLDKAVERMKMKGYNDGLYLEIKLLSYGFQKTNCGKWNGTLFKCRDTKEKKPFIGMFPTIDIRGDLGSNKCKINVYAEEAKVARVNTFYDAVICCYCIYWIFNIEYEETVQSIFQDFDAILELG